MLEEFRRSTSGALDRAKLVFHREAQDESEEQEDTSWTEELSNYCPTLTFQQRLIGFASSFGLGYLIAFMSFRFFIRLIEGNPLPFALNYTFGHSKTRSMTRLVSVTTFTSCIHAC